MPNQWIGTYKTILWNTPDGNLGDNYEVTTIEDSTPEAVMENETDSPVIVNFHGSKEKKSTVTKVNDGYEVETKDIK